MLEETNKTCKNLLTYCINLEDGLDDFEKYLLDKNPKFK